MSIEVRVTPAAVDVLVGGWDRVWGLRRRVELPIGRIRNARVMDNAEAKADVKLRTGGLGLPGVALVGYMRGRKARKQWWRVYRAPKVAVIDLTAESQFDRVVLQVENPRRLVAEIESARRAAP